MPELPEIETIRNSLETIIGTRISRTDFKRQDIIKREDFAPDQLVGMMVKSIGRRGKFLILYLEQGYYLVVHLGMSGRFYILDRQTHIEAPHVHLIIYLDDGRRLVYQDPRRFGGIRLCHDLQLVFAHMGVEPLSRQFTGAHLAALCHGRQVAIKNLLLNQCLISGIGNIYADEALFRARVRGTRPAGSLTAAEIKRLHRAIREVLRQSIAAQGTTFRDYRDGWNQEGNFQNFLQVYGKTGHSCSNCGRPIQREIIGGRSSHYCGHCQK
ncbi:MAG: bifunctional DNA-formamidopyrimidine glycosylase/DNA-(apurinic or apyrimidinic site) lyase [Syntrophomonas sp.]|nr:bifunctional DNA-formamidopyrimidine glycosylase/DNA-(apurinic or apyrimidinic site) lyase [Syntrophomonas sp.]